jgi:predicted neuraminidase
MNRVSSALLLLTCLTGGFTRAAGAEAVSTADRHPAVVQSGFIYEEAPFPSCHASTVVETSAGTLLTAFFGGTHERHPDVGIWLSRREQGRWTAPIEVANGIQHFRTDGTVARHPTWNPVLFQPAQGPLMLFYKVGPSPQTWWGMLMTSTDDGRTWSEPRRLPEGVLGPIKNKPVQLADGAIFCPSSSESPETGWTVHFEVTRDLGRSWTVIGPINTQAEFNAIQPSVLWHADGRLQILCRTKEQVVATSWSRDQGRTWSPLASTGLPNPNSGTDAVTLRDGRQLLVYNPSIRPPEGGGRTPLTVAVSKDGLAWVDQVVLETDQARHGYSYPAVIQTRDGRVHITYTWRREKIRHVVLDPERLRP